jgi:SAM-dependent methyltransferase
MESSYFDKTKIAAGVSKGRHRDLVGGLWNEVGTLQLDFLRARGLAPRHKLLDVGCGALRGGVHFAGYLDPGNYFGVDISQELLDAGYDIELAAAGLQDRVPRQNLLCTGEFDVSAFGERFDVALAQSLFTHLSLNRIRQCLERLAPMMTPGGVFYATFFERPEGRPASEAIRHEPGGIVTFGERDPYHYSVADFEHAARNLPWLVSRIGDWGHPRAQRMLAFTRDASPAERRIERRGKRDLPLDEAARLRPGDSHYRAYVGPPDRYDFMSATQFALLHATGLREGHRVLDFGCGSLRLGRLLIPFLREGRYFGIDPNRWLIEDAIDRELGRDIIRLKSPCFAYNDDFDCSTFGSTFDFVVAQSIVTHCGPDLFRKLMKSLEAVLAPDGLALFSYIRDEDGRAEPPADGWHYPTCVAYTQQQVALFLEEARLVGTPLPWFHPRAVWHAASRTGRRLPTEAEKQSLSGAVLFDPQFENSRRFAEPLRRPDRRPGTAG